MCRFLAQNVQSTFWSSLYKNSAVSKNNIQISKHIRKWSKYDVVILEESSLGELLKTLMEANITWWKYRISHRAEHDFKWKYYCWFKIYRMVMRSPQHGKMYSNFFHRPSQHVSAKVCYTSVTIVGDRKFMDQVLRQNWDSKGTNDDKWKQRTQMKNLKKVKKHFHKTYYCILNVTFRIALLRNTNW